MSRLIDADELRNGLFHLEGETGITDRQLGYQAGWNDALMYGVLDAPTVDAVEVVRCKDCKHKPTGSGVNHDITFPKQDYRCPCRCEDYWYSWMPDDEWFCAWGERKDEVEDE